jgi:hypothetical protein
VVYELQRADLSRATYAVTKLAGEFPRALPTIVGDAGAWVAAVRRLLDLLKPWVHRNVAAPNNLFDVDGVYSHAVGRSAAKLTDRVPELERLVEAVSWMMSTRPAEVGRHLRWIDEHACELRVVRAAMSEQDAVVFSLQAAHLAVSLGAKLVAPMLRVAGEPATYEYPLQQGKEFVAQAVRVLSKRHSGRDRSLPDSPPGPHLPQQLRNGVEWLIGQDPRVQRRFLTYFRLAEWARPVDEWARWWPSAIAKVAKARDVLASALDAERRHAFLKKARADLDALHRSAPHGLHVPGVFDAMKALSAREHAASFAPASAALAALDATADATLRAGFLIHWRKLADKLQPRDRRRLPLLLRAFRGYLATAGCDLSPWRSKALVQGALDNYQFTVDDDILDAGFKSDDFARVFAAFALFVSRHPHTPLDAATDRIVDLIEVCHDERVASEVVEQMVVAKRHEEWWSQSALRSALRTTEPDWSRFVDVLERFARLEERSELTAEQIYEPMSKVFEGNESLMALMLLGNQRNKLLACARRVALLAEFGRPLSLHPPAHESGWPWIATYPSELRESLERMARVSTAAEKIAKRVTKGVIPDVSALTREATVLRRQLRAKTGSARDRQQRRLTNIEARLVDEQQISPSKLRRLSDKLDRATARELLASVDAQSVEEIEDALLSWLGENELPDWIAKEPYLELILPILKLSRRQRNLALRLLRLRCGPPPWDLRSDPANATFLRSLEKLGMDPTPWVEGIGVVPATTKRGAVALALEVDPLEVFRMGAHFQTCLSPGQFNFFSAVTNAADINKRVLFARDGKGKVVGRRLLCLTEHGAMLAFNAYCHDANYEFQALSTRFATDLAEAIGTNIVARGSVPVLVATDWYDDGPVDIARQFAFLEEGSELRNALPSISGSEFVERVRWASEGLRLEEHVVPMLVRLPELDDRPELVAALLSGLDIARLPGDTCLRMGLLLEATASPTAANVLAPRVAEFAREHHRRHRQLDYAVASFLARQCPTIALRVLRQTRERGVRAWSAETRTERLAAAAIALLGLNRRKQAQRLFELAANADGSSDVKREANRRLRELQQSDPQTTRDDDYGAAQGAARGRL